MAEDDIKINAGMDDGDDTKTRKTVRLKPSATTPASIKLPTPGAPIADPLTGRDTDTGNLEILEDTQTRRTVKLKPIAPQRVVNQPIKLQGSEVPPAAPAAPAAGAAVDGENTQTRKTLVLRPSAVPPSSVKVGGQPAAPAAPAAPAPKTFAAPRSSEEAAENDETIRISRPVKAKAPVDPSKKTVMLPNQPGAVPVDNSSRKTVEMPPEILDNSTNKTVVMPTGLPPAVEEDDKSTVKLPQPKKPAAPPAPPSGLNLKRDPEPPKAPEPAKELNVKEEKAPEPAPAPAAKPAAMIYEDAPRPSMAYLVLAALSFVLLIGTTAITTVEYLNLCQNQNIELPGLPQVK
ncbi:hypothetical protein [Victivallis vadensis]|uniref:hypothetical protein n=1 Tax=Victivallis vadensis TaxID=172901 RepID=UPI003AF92549